MSTPVPPVVVKAFATSGTKATIPVAAPVTPGRASYDLGFPPVTMADLSVGGIPPSGADMNGILYALSAHIAWLHAGGCYIWSSDVVSVAGGYVIGAVVQSAISPGTFFQNTVANNTNDPDSVITGWLAYSPVGGAIGLQSTTLATGTNSDLPLALGTGFLDLDLTTGDADLTGISATHVTDGQTLVITNVNASHLITLKAFNVGSVLANRFRAPSDFTLLQYGSVTFRYSSAIGMWTLS